MRIRQPAGALLSAGVLGFFAVCISLADGAPKLADPGPLVVLDSVGKEQKLKTWTYVAGTRHITWLAPTDKEPEPGAPDKDAPAKDKPGKEKPKPPAGPEALEFREENSTVYADGILTLIPLDRLRSLDYDVEKETVVAAIAAGPKADDDVKLTGVTKFLKINKLIIEAEVDKGDLGLAEVKFLGGVAKGGIKGLRFPAAKGEAAPAGGRPTVVISSDRTGRASHKVTELLPLYRFADGREQTSPLLFFKKTLKIDVAKIKSIVTSPADDEEKGWQVTLKDGNDENLSLLRKVTLNDKPAELVGLVARVPAGYKLFPLHAVAEIKFDSTEEETKPDPDK